MMMVGLGWGAQAGTRASTQPVKGAHSGTKTSLSEVGWVVINLGEVSCRGQDTPGVLN